MKSVTVRVLLYQRSHLLGNLHRQQVSLACQNNKFGAKSSGYRPAGFDRTCHIQLTSGHKRWRSHRACNSCCIFRDCRSDDGNNCFQTSADTRCINCSINKCLARVRGKAATRKERGKKGTHTDRAYKRCHAIYIKALNGKSSSKGRNGSHSCGRLHSKGKCRAAAEGDPDYMRPGNTKLIKHRKCIVCVVICRKWTGLPRPPVTSKIEAHDATAATENRNDIGPHILCHIDTVDEQYRLIITPCGVGIHYTDGTS